MTETNKKTATIPVNVENLLEDLDLLKDDIDDLQTLWEKFEEGYLSTAGLTGNKLRQFNAFVRMISDLIDRASAQACSTYEEMIP